MTLRIALLVAGAIGAASATFPITDTDIYWHLATARETLARGFIRSDLFSWTIPGAPVPVDQWLGQLLLYAGYAVGEWQGVIAVRTLAVALLVGLIAAAALVRRSGSPVVALAIAVPAILLSRYIWTERPELFGAALFAALVLLLQLPGERPLFAIAPLLIVWANVHGSFALGSGLVALVAIHGLAMDRPLRRGYAVALAGALLSLVLTPAGLGTLTTPGIHLFDPPREIQEWAIPDPRTAAGAVWALILATTIATAALSPVGARARDMLLIVPVALLSLIAIRHAPLFAIAATPYLAARLPTAVQHAIEGVFGAARATDGRPHAAIPGGPLAFVAVSGALLIGAIAIAPRGPNEAAFPVAALASLPRDGLLNEYDWGGWLIWRGMPVFIDGRLVPYRDRVLHDYETIVGAKPGWRDVITRDGIRWLLLRPSQPAAVRAQDLGWRVVSRSTYHVLIQVPAATP